MRIIRSLERNSSVTELDYRVHGEVTRLGATIDIKHVDDTQMIDYGVALTWKQSNWVLRIDHGLFPQYLYDVLK